MAYNNHKKGFLVLTMVLLVSAVVLAVATGVFLRSIDELNQTADSEHSLQAWATVNGCGEYAISRLATSSVGWEYGGDGPLEIGANTCYIYPIEASSTARLIKASSTVSNFTRKIIVEVATNTPSLIVTSWQVVADFE